MKMQYKFNSLIKLYSMISKLVGPGYTRWVYHETVCDNRREYMETLWRPHDRSKGYYKVILSVDKWWTIWQGY